MPPTKQARSRASPSGRTQRKRPSLFTWPSGRNPHELVASVVSGTLSLESCDANVQSLCSREVYEIACAVLAEKTIEKRREKLAGVPELLRPHVEREARRVWEYRKEQ